MWTSTNFKTYKQQFDFTSSEQGNSVYTTLKINGFDFINIIERLDGEIEQDQIFQTILCSSCGFHHCEPGNWVALRQLGDFIFFIPAFSKLRENENQNEYAPPYWFNQNGSFWLTNSDFDKFKKLIPELDKLNSINRFTKFELLALYKSETPHKMFGNFPNYEPLRKKHAFAVSELDVATILEIIESKLQELEASINYEVTTLQESDKIISVFLGDSSLTEWKALCKTEEGYELLLGGTFKFLIK